MFKSKFFRTYLLPGFIFQSIVVGGGYGTGRELVEFFMVEGPLAGLMGMMVSMILWSIILAISFELARMSKSYNYRTFIKSVLGKGWPIYEIVYGIGLVLVVSVLGSASGKLAYSMFGLPEIAGIIMMMIMVGLLAFYGTKLIERVLSFWSIGLYLAFFILIVTCLWFFGGQIADNIFTYTKGSKWLQGGIRYSAYNIGIMPAMIYVVRHFDNRKEALISGTVAGALTMIPGFFIYIAMLSSYPEILSESIPINFLLGTLGFPAFMFVFQIILFGTFIETGVGLIHGFNERVAGVYKEKNKVMPRSFRAGIAVIILTCSIFIADAVGIVSLIAKGYGALTWGYMLAFVIPVLTIGLYKIKLSKS
ncbi:MAG: hypothetical protein DRI71_11085 [Bacteroidetes bacterium]|nr:MAG: hypothetical protein DRI71_11085 [Bacteroidota bacterium]